MYFWSGLLTLDFSSSFLLLSFDSFFLSEPPDEPPEVLFDEPPPDDDLLPEGIAEVGGVGQSRVIDGCPLSICSLQLIRRFLLLGGWAM